jgi:DDE superfamily endonuclease
VAQCFELVRNIAQATRASGGVIDPITHLALTLRILAGASYLDLVLLCAVHRSTVFHDFHETLAAINKRLSMPGVPIGDAAKLRKLADEFMESRTPASPLYGCVGALDGIAVSVTKPPDKFFPRNIFRRKGMYAIPVQAVADSSYIFLYMSANCVGSTHDSLPFARSGLGMQLADTGGDNLRGFWIAEYAAYDCQNGVITPWSKCQLQNESERIWRDSSNSFHSSLRMRVEQAFGLLGAPFGILWRPVKLNITRVVTIVSA